MQRYGARLRRTALNIPERVIREGVAGMKKRAQAIFDAEGGHIDNRSGMQRNHTSRCPT